MMRSFLLAAACGLLLLASTDVGHAQKKKKGGGGPPPNSSPATLDDYAQLNQVKELGGKLLLIDPVDAKDKKSLTFRYEYYMTEANPKYKPTKVVRHDFTKEIQKLDLQQQKAMQITNLVKRQTALDTVAFQRQQLFMRRQQEQLTYEAKVREAQQRDTQSGNVPYLKVMKAKDFKLEIEEKVVIRRHKPAMEYDDRGFIKEYSKTELEKLHLVDNKEKKKPGYPSKYEELQTGQTIMVYLTPGKRDKVDQAKDDPKTPNPNAVPPIPTVHTISILEDIPNPNNVPKK